MLSGGPYLYRSGYRLLQTITKQHDSKTKIVVFYSLIQIELSQIDSAVAACRANSHAIVTNKVSI